MNCEWHGPRKEGGGGKGEGERKFRKERRGGMEE